MFIILDIRSFLGIITSPENSSI